MCGLGWVCRWRISPVGLYYQYLFIYLFTNSFKHMPTHTDTLRLSLAGGPRTARQLADSAGISQPTVSRVLTQLGADVIRMGRARSIQYALRDRNRGLPDIPVYRVTREGGLMALGTLVPVRPEGFVMVQTDGVSLHSDGLPWWLFDMRPQGYLGRAYAARHHTALGLPERLGDWTDTHVLRALTAQGHDSVGNLLLGDVARNQFLAQPEPVPIAQNGTCAAYARLARRAANGEVPGSSAGGEQPKFVAYVQRPDGPAHVIVKFSEAEAGPVSTRWRDLLRVEHRALQTLAAHGVAAAPSRLLEDAAQTFLEVRRFDRLSAHGRLGLISLGALDAEFAGLGGRWPDIAQRLAEERIITGEAATTTSLLWAFGALIGNTDMHGGNLSFVAENGRPYALAPAYDMTSMAFAPGSGGGLRDTLAPVSLLPEIPNAVWHAALQLARDCLARLLADTGFSVRFAPCLGALSAHMAEAATRIARLA